MKTFTVKQVLFLLIVTLGGVLWSVLFHRPLVIGFLPGFFVLVLLSKMKKMMAKQIIFTSFKGAARAKIVILILFLVSFLLPSWYLSGTIDQMVKVALSIILPQHFLVLSFLTALCFSMLLGTSVGTLSSIGIPVLGTAAILHLPIEIVAGALVSGAFVGDRTSPFSSSHQLLSHTLEIPLKKQWRAMLPSTVSAVLFSFFFYYYEDVSISGKLLVNHQSFQWSELSFLKFIPPLVLILFVIFRTSIVYAFIASILSAVMISLTDYSIGKIIAAFWYGIHGLGGGLANMYELLLFLALAGAYNGLLEEMNVIQPYLDKWLNSSRTLMGDTFKALAASLLITFIAANQTLPIILTGRSFLPHWVKKYGNGELARVMGDSTMLFPGIVPWSVLTIMCETLVGVPLLKYIPYAIFVWILPILTLFISFVKNFRKGKFNRSAAA